MATITKSLAKKRFQYNDRINWNYFLQDNLTGSWLTMVTVAVLLVLTALAFVGAIGARPGITWIITLIWLAAVVVVAVGELFTLNLYVNDWLKKNLISSVSNALLTLFLALLITTVLSGIVQWGIIDATWSPARTPTDLRGEGATWGVIWDARDLLMVGRYPRPEMWRVWCQCDFGVGALVLDVFDKSAESQRTPLHCAQGDLCRLATVAFPLLYSPCRY